MMKILLLEDDLILSELIKEYLESNSYYVEAVFTAEDAEEELYSTKYDLLLFDINLPLFSGLEVLKKIRLDKMTIPIIFMTASNNFKDFKEAYDLGANDFIRKPFKLEELLIRIKYIKKIFLIKSSSIIEIDKEIKFDLLNMCIIQNDLRIKLPKKESEIIRYFLLNKNRIITTDELIINIWDYDKEPSIATIRTYIKNIRKNLNHHYLETVKGLGYILKI